MASFEEKQDHIQLYELCETHRLHSHQIYSSNQELLTILYVEKHSINHLAMKVQPIYCT